MSTDTTQLPLEPEKPVDGAYHAHSGLTFKRLPGGKVEIRIYESPDFTGEFKEFILDKDTWASAVASVSYQGDTLEQWQAALHLHDDFG